MALQANALVTAEQARLWVKRAINATVNDDILELAINGVSDAIENYCQREFKPPVPNADLGAPVTRVFRYDGEGYLSLAPYDLRSLGGAGYGDEGSIVLYNDQPTVDQVTLLAATGTAEAWYRLGPRNGTRDGTYLWLGLPAFIGDRALASFNLTRPRWLTRTNTFEAEVAVTGYWGMTQVPGAVVSACLIAVAREFRNPEGFASRSMGPLGFSEDIDTGDLDETFALPKRARSLLWPYRRVNIARGTA
jgi:hypothetical protein